MNERAIVVPEYRLYVDEAGDHSPCRDEDSSIGTRYLGLTGVVVQRGGPDLLLRGQLEQLKKTHFPAHDIDDPVILHREDIVKRRGAFGVLTDRARNEAFEEDLLRLLTETDFRVIAVALDKFKHGRATYRRLKHSYHYALLALLERYCGWLKFAGFRGDVLVESRGGTEDLLFKEAYGKFYSEGSGMYFSATVAQATLTSKQPKLKKKEMNLAGLQLADLLAHPLTRDVLVRYKRISSRGGDFADRVAGVADSKYNRHVYQNRIEGYGCVLLE